MWRLPTVGANVTHDPGTKYEGSIWNWVVVVVVAMVLVVGVGAVVVVGVVPNAGAAPLVDTAGDLVQATSRPTEATTRAHRETAGRRRDGPITRVAVVTRVRDDRASSTAPCHCPPHRLAAGDADHLNDEGARRL